MPELPEVETVMRGLLPHIEHKTIESVVLRHHQLRWPIPPLLNEHLNQKRVNGLTRRGKYILMHLNSGTLIIHLGMSGSLRLVSQNTPILRHDHVDIIFSDQTILRYNDPRRFGALLWTQDDPYQHILLRTLGIEPFDQGFTADYLKQRASNRQIAIKPFIMDSKIVVGVGNIYAAESLFLAGIHPETPAGLLTQIECQRLVTSIRDILQLAIKQGGSTIRDFINSDGKPGYFAQRLNVYGRGGLACRVCQNILLSFKQGSRSTVFCVTCQPAKIM